MDSTPVEPTASFRPRHTGAQRAVFAFSIIVALACFAGAAGLLIGKYELDQRLATPEVTYPDNSPLPASTQPGDTASPSTAPPETFPVADPEAKNFLITGSDANACVDPNSPWAGAADPQRPGSTRSDTIMVMRVDPVTRAAAVLSFPRDLWVKIPGKSKNRINSAYIKDDYSLLAQTIFENFGVQVQHYIQVDFCAFKRIVDAVGGVAVPFETRVLDKNTGLDVPAGCHTFSGDEALAYVRSRHLRWVDASGKTHEDPASDLGRISRQQDFLRRTLQAALDKGVFNPAVARALIKSLQTDVVTEQGFTIDDMLQFAGVLRDVDPAGITTYQVEGSRLIVSGNDVLEPKIKGDNMRAILAIFRGEAPLLGAPEQTFGTTTVPTLPPGTATPDTGTPSSTSAPVTTEGPVENVKGIVPPKDVQC